MSREFDIAIRRARLRHSGDRLIEIGITDGHIAAMAENLDAKATNEIDARGNLVTESYVNPHLHLCKVWTLPTMEEEALKSYQGEAMGKAKQTLAAAVASAAKANNGFQATSAEPTLEGGRPVASVTLMKGEEIKKVTEKLD